MSLVGESQAVVFGASGSIGRCGVKVLLEQGASVTAAARSPSSRNGLIVWLDSDSVPRELLDF